MTVDMTTDYLGLRLAHPIMPSASPMTGDIDRLLALEAAGAPAVVLPSLFEEQIEQQEIAIANGLEVGAATFAEAPEGYFPDFDDYNSGPDDYLELIKAAKRQLHIPVIGSLNGDAPGGWARYAGLLEDAGVDAIELNIYLVAGDIDTPGEAIERRYLRLVEVVRSTVSVPLAVKVGPYFSSMANMASRLVDAGADALVLFNRFYQPDIDPDTLRVTPNLDLSRSEESRLVVRWMAMLSGRLPCRLAATTGIHTSIDAVKVLLAGADVAMMASALLRHRPERLTEVIDGTRQWLDERGYESVAQARGSLSQRNSPDPAAFERANYMKTLVSFSAPEI